MEEITFVASGIYSHDIGPSTVPIDPPFADRLREELAPLRFDSGLRSMVFQPLIVSPALGTVPDGIHYRPSEAGVRMCVNIPAASWVAASRAEQVNLYAQALKTGIGRLKDTKLIPADKETFIAAVERVRAEMGTRFCERAEE